MVEITPAALARFEELAATNAGKVIRFVIDSGGCNGFTKKLELSVPADGDIQIQAGTTSLVMDPITSEIGGDATIDWVQGVIGNHFNISIPSATGGCGCGDSFSI